MTAFETLTDLWTDTARERGLVAAAIVDAEIRFALLDLVNVDSFADSDAAAAWGHIVAENLADAAAVVATWPASVDPITDARKIEALAIARSLSDVPRELQRRIDQMARGEASPDTVAAQLAEISMRASQRITPAQALQPAAYALAGVLADVAQRKEHFTRTGDSIMGMRTGIGALDRMLGGIQRRRLIVLMSPPNIGKTTLTNQIAYRLAEKDGVCLYVTFENPPDDLIRKQLARIAQIPASDIDAGKADTVRVSDAASIFQRMAGERLYYIEGTANTTTAVIRGYVAQLTRRHPGRQITVFVDYLQKLASRPNGDGSPGYDDLRGNVSKVTQELQDIARQLDCAVLAISSVNRSSYNNENARANMGSAKESGSIEFDADALLILENYRTDDDNAPVLIAPGMTPMRLRVEKNRFGDKGAVRLAFIPKQALFTEIDDRGKMVS